MRLGVMRRATRFVPAAHSGWQTGTARAPAGIRLTALWRPEYRTARQSCQRKAAPRRVESGPGVEARMNAGTIEIQPGTAAYTLALVGAGEFLPSMRAVDEQLLTVSGGRRVAILPTASAPDGPEVFERWAAMGEAHFRALGAQVEVVAARTRADCLDPDIVRQIASVDLVYFSGGKPDYLLAALTQTPAWEAVLALLQRGGVVAGCSAGAMILGAFIPAFRLRQLPGRDALWMPGFGLVPQAIVIPHFNEIPRSIVRAWLALRPSGTRAFGVDAGTALVGRPGAWRVLGEGSVTLADGEGECAYGAGEPFP